MNEPVAERWLPAHGWEQFYAVSDLGRVKSFGRMIRCRNGFRWQEGTILRPCPHPGGYQLVSLHAYGRSKKVTIHSLVLTTFVGPRPPGWVACHANDIPDDNRLVNLRWDTPSSNSRDIVRHGRHPQASKTHCHRGHPFTEANTYYGRNGGSRNCRACRRYRHALRTGADATENTRCDLQSA